MRKKILLVTIALLSLVSVATCAATQNVVALPGEQFSYEKDAIAVIGIGYLEDDAIAAKNDFEKEKAVFADAMNDAQSKAKIVAELSGRKLGKPVFVGVWENSLAGVRNADSISFDSKKTPPKCVILYVYFQII